MPRLGFVYDQSHCIGCNACQIACKDANDLEAGLVYRRVETMESPEGAYPVMHYSGGCNHCKDAACVRACPTGAMHYAPEGTVVHDGGKCIGCGTCTWVCPYGAPKLSHKTGKAVKCGACVARRAQGKQPACVEACITHCLQFGDLEELTRGREEEYTNTLPFLPDPAITDPSLRIRKGAKHA